ncbi:MAG: hypothetical protein IKW45_04405 [Clostridia bacterium]|nr:hypothetical protein [Clostridia bacterium]
MKKILSIFIFFLCCILLLNIGEKIQQKAIENEITDDKYTAAEFEDFQQQLSKKTFYYYDHLTEEQKDAYITLYYAVLNFDESCKVKISETELKKIIYSIIYDNSNIFWLSGNYTYYSHEDYIELIPEYNHSEKEVEEISTKLNNKINEIISQISVVATDYEKELYLHDYICNNTVYDASTFKNGGDTAYSSLLNGKSICEGYARAMQILLDFVGIKNYLVIGDGVSEGVIEPHMWNIVEIDGYNYHLDVTWDDSVTNDSNCYFYFNVTDEYIRRDHLNMEPIQNNCINNYANYYVVNNTYIQIFSGFESLVNTTSNSLRKGNNSVGFLFNNSSDFKRAVNEVNNNSKFFNYIDRSVKQSGRNLSTTNVEYVLVEDYHYLKVVFKEG